jgi:hypothetical protein
LTEKEKEFLLSIEVDLNTAAYIAGQKDTSRQNINQIAQKALLKSQINAKLICDNSC